MAQVCISARSLSETLNAKGFVCIRESEKDNDSMFALRKPIPEQENANVFDNLMILQA